MSWLIAETIGEELALLTDDEIRHLRSAKRAKPGDTVAVIDGRGVRGTGVWCGDARVEVRRRETFVRPTICLAFGLGSRESNETSLRRAAELGAAEIIPVLARRSRDAGAGRRPPRLDRWYRIIESGCAQSGNPWFPTLADAVEWSSLRDRWTEPGHVVCAPGAPPLLGVASHGIRAIAVGPEGGFADDEVHGLQCVGLGRWVLRTPVAVAVALGVMEQAA